MPELGPMLVQDITTQDVLRGGAALAEKDGNGIPASRAH